MRKLIKEKSDVFDYLPARIAALFSNTSNKVLDEICEIRLRKDSPVALSFKDKTVFIQKNGSFCELITGNEYVVSKEELNECFLNLCNRSVFAHEEEIKEGFISLKNGGRVGIAANFGGGVLKEVNSLNIRIPHEIFGCASSLKERVQGGLLIAGPPSSGKTTLLRDLCRILSSGETGIFYRLAVIDSRGEIATGMKMGETADVISISNKAKGVEIALRTLSPQIIAFDEIGTRAELNSVSDCLNAGVTVLTTAHSGGISELLKRNVTKELLYCGAIKNVVLLSGKVGETPRFFETEEIINGY